MVVRGSQHHASQAYELELCCVCCVQECAQEKTCQPKFGHLECADRVFQKSAQRAFDGRSENQRKKVANHNYEGAR